jgi:hypothetical protein
LAIGGAGRNGGNGFGGGVYNDAGTVSIEHTRIIANQVLGGDGGDGGTDGQGVGGGAYFGSDGSVCLDAATLAAIFGNFASTSDDDVFGDFMICE